MGARYVKVTGILKKRFICDVCGTCGDPKCCKTARNRSFYQLGFTDKCKCSKCLGRVSTNRQDTKSKKE